VELPATQQGHRDSVWHLTTQSGCLQVAPERERHVPSNEWTVGPRVLDFHGAIDPANPTTLVGETQFDQGWVRWNLFTSLSAALRLTILPPTNGLVRFTWLASPGARLQQSLSLSSPNWQDIPNTEGSNSAAFPPSATSSFFRLLKR